MAFTQTKTTSISSSIRLNGICLLLCMMILLGFNIEKIHASTLNATLNFTYLWQDIDEGEYYNGYHFSVENTGDINIFAVFLYPQYPAYTGGAGNNNNTGNWNYWAGWSAAAYYPSLSPVHYWYEANSGNTYITEIDDVPNPNGWGYSNWMGIWWNTSHNSATHQDSYDSLTPGATITDLYYTIWGVDEGDPSVPALTVMLAGFNGTSVVTNTFTLNSVPIPGAVWLLGSGLIGIVGIRKKFNK